MGKILASKWPEDPLPVGGGQGGMEGRESTKLFLAKEPKASYLPCLSLAFSSSKWEHNCLPGSAAVKGHLRSLRKTAVSTGLWAAAHHILIFLHLGLFLRVLPPPPL